MNRLKARHRPVVLTILVIGLLLSGALGVRLAAQPHRPEGYPSEMPLIIRIYYDDIRDLARLQAYDVWEYNNLEERYVLAAVDLAGYQTLVAEGWTATIDETAAERLSRRGAFNDGYRSVNELYAEIEAMNAAAPKLTEIVEYGQSYCLAAGGCVTPGGDELPGYPLRAVRVTNEDMAGSSEIDGPTVTRGEKPIFFLMANIHAREITTPEIAMRYLETLLDGYGVDADITWLIDYHEIWIVPTINPDGHWLVELGDKPGYGEVPFYQRKNANAEIGGNGKPACNVWPPSSFTQYGIDLNRNHSFAWGPPGSSDQPCDMTYRGASVASEVEVASLEALMLALFPDQRGPGLNDPAPADTTGLMITLHSFSNLVLWPWGHIEAPAPNKVDLQTIGDKFATYNGYLSCQPTLCLYGTNGASDDWAYGELGIPAFTFEMGNEFMPPFSEIDDRQWPDNGPALFYAAKIARTPYMTVHGPDVLEPTVSGEAPELTITATIDDSDNGGNAVSAAVFSIDTPPWQDGATLISMTPTDGAFDGPEESVNDVIDTTGLASGRHIAFVMAQDDEGNWGAVSAAFFEVEGAPPSEYLYLPFAVGD